jgi:hypothetical protein
LSSSGSSPIATCSTVTPSGSQLTGSQPVDQVDQRIAGDHRANPLVHQ